MSTWAKCYILILKSGGAECRVSEGDCGSWRRIVEINCSFFKKMKNEERDGNRKSDVGGRGSGELSTRRPNDGVREGPKCNNGREKSERERN